MDDKRRADLLARRRAMRDRSRARQHAQAREAFVRMVPILAALEAAGEDYRSDGYGALRGALNLWAHAPGRSPVQAEAGSYAALPAEPIARDAVILSRLSARAGEDGLVTVILRHEALVLELRLSALARHLPTLIENGGSSELGFASPPADWIVHVTQEGIESGTLAGPGA